MGRLAAAEMFTSAISSEQNGNEAVPTVRPQWAIAQRELSAAPCRWRDKRRRVLGGFLWPS
jgi:hypothetical protein